MCKRICALALVLTLTIISGCCPEKSLSDSGAGIYHQIHKKFSRMESYTATVRLTVKSNKTDNIYTMTQKVKVPDQAVMTITEPEALAGVTTVYSGGNVSVSALPNETSLTLPSSETTNDLFVHHFFSLFYQSEETSVTVSATQEEKGTLLLETIAIPASSKRYRLTLLCDTSKLEPKVLTVYDVGGNIRMIAEFSDFSFNPSLDPEIFLLPDV